MLSLHMHLLKRFDEEIAITEKLVNKMEPYEKLSADVAGRLKELRESLVNECGKKLFVIETCELVNEYKLALRNPIDQNAQCAISNLKKQIEAAYATIVKRTLVKLRWFDIDTGVNTIVQTNCCPTCKNSDSTMFETDSVGRISCLVCFTEIATLEVVNTHLDYNRATVTGKFIYNRVLHFQDCIKQFQGKQNCKIPQSVYDYLDSKFEAYRLLVDSPDKRVKYSKITKQHVLMFLKDIPKHYENINVIYTTLTGKSGEDISHLEHQLVEDFKTLVTLYDSIHSKDKMEELDRKNFLNVQYILFQLLRKYDYNCKAEDFSMLKTSERKQFHDQICSNLFNRLGWNFTKTF